MASHAQHCMALLTAALTHVSRATLECNKSLAIQCRSADMRQCSHENRKVHRWKLLSVCLWEKTGMSRHESAHYLCTSMTLSFLQKGAKVFDLLSAPAYARQSCTRLTRSICRMSAELDPPLMTQHRC